MKANIMQMMAIGIAINKPTVEISNAIKTMAPPDELEEYFLSAALALLAEVMTEKELDKLQATAIALRRMRTPHERPLSESIDDNLPVCEDCGKKHHTLESLLGMLVNPNPTPNKDH